jgi:hypothetical protein
MAQRAVFTVAVGLVLLVGLALWPVQVVSLKLPRENNRWIASIPAAEGDTILLAYRHSVELTAVEGHFQVGPQSEIFALKTRMQSAGTGLPNTAYNRTAIRNGWIEVDEARFLSYRSIRPAWLLPAETPICQPLKQARCWRYRSKTAAWSNGCSIFSTAVGFQQVNKTKALHESE